MILSKRPDFSQSGLSFSLANAVIRQVHIFKFSMVEIYPMSICFISNLFNSHLHRHKYSYKLKKPCHLKQCLINFELINRVGTQGLRKRKFLKNIIEIIINVYVYLKKSNPFNFD